MRRRGPGSPASRQHPSMWKGADRPGVCIFLCIFLCFFLAFYLSICLCLCLCLCLSLSLFETVWGLCCHILAILAHLGAMFPISGTYVGSSCGYVCHIWDLCWVIWRASVRSSWSTFSAIDVGARPTPTKCRLILSARRALPTPPLKNTAFWHFSLFAASLFVMRTKSCKPQCVVLHTHTKHCKL